MSIDQRYANPVVIGGGPALVVGVPVGSKVSASNASSIALAAAMTTMRQRGAEIRSHSQLLPSEQDRRLNELRHPAISAVRQHRRVLAAEKARTQTLSATASYVRPSSSLPAHTLAEDGLLLQKFMNMDISARTQLTARCMADPVQHLRWAEVLLRAPRELTDIPLQMHNELRFAVLAAFDPAQVEAIQAQEAQVAMAQRALDLAEQALSETLVGALAESREEPEPEPEKPTAITPEQYLAAVPQAVIDDLKSGGRLSRPAGIELSRVQA